MELEFKKCYCRYRVLQIVITAANDVTQLYLTVQICIGVVLSSCGFYITLKMYNLLNILTYMLGPSLVCICCVIAITWTFLAGIPCKNSYLEDIGEYF